MSGSLISSDLVIVLCLAALLAISGGLYGTVSATDTVPVAITQMKNVKQVPVVEKWDKTFKRNPNVAHQKVEFKNRYGVTLVGDLSYSGESCCYKHDV